MVRTSNKELDQFAYRTWSALCIVQDHFAQMGGGNRYPTFELDHPPLVIGILVLLERRKPGVLSLLSQINAFPRMKFNDYLRELSESSPELHKCMQELALWDRQRFDDKLLKCIISTLANDKEAAFSVPRGGLYGFATIVQESIPQHQRHNWKSFRKHVIRQELELL